MKLHAFVAMPFGVKEGIDFDRVYADLIKPALAEAGLDAFRADEEMKAGDIRKDMFQELLLADLVLVDVSIDNPNVWYELGVRHALRERDVVVIACREGRLPFDISTDRVVRYQRHEGVPDPATLSADKTRLTQFVKATLRAASDERYRSSPVYATLPELKEPEWGSLKVKGATGFWRTYDEWHDRVEVARRRSRAGDVLLLAEETPIWVFRNEAYRLAGSALTKLNQFGLALEQYQKAYALDPKDRESEQRIGLLLGRAGRHDEAREWINNIIEKYPDNAESHALMGRLEKEEWISRWRVAGSTPQAFVEQAKLEEALLDAAVEPYVKAFALDPSHFYSGINALVLRQAQHHLDCEPENAVDMEALAGGVAWACRAALTKAPKDYWARVTLADLRLITGDKERALRGYRSAIASADRDWFALDSSRQQLMILRDFGFRAELTAEAITAFDQELKRITPPWRPKRVFLFSGHMIDKADRAEARFPAAMEPLAQQAIAAKLAELGAGADDLAITSAACGGDLLFVEACQARGVRIEVYLPYEAPVFLQHSVTFAGEDWQKRFNAMKDVTSIQVFEMPERLGAGPEGVSAYMRNNRWMLYSALAHGPSKVRFVSLWDGQKGDGPGGTEDMVATVRKYSGEVHVLDAKALLKQFKETT